MLGRKKDDVTTVATSDEEAHGSHVARPGAKNRPTPKRRDQEAARRRLVVETDRKKAAARDRTHSRADARTRQQAMLRGEEWALLPRDQGAFRRYARDVVDARWSVGEFLMPVILVCLVLTWIMSATGLQWLFYPVMALTYGVFAAAILDAVIAYRRLRKRFVAAHPNEPVPSGSGMYAGMRMMQMRFSRAPRPQVARGEFPR